MKYKRIPSNQVPDTLGCPASNSGLHESLDWDSPSPRNLTHTIHVWYIYLHLVDFLMANVGKYTRHGWYG